MVMGPYEKAMARPRIVPCGHGSGRSVVPSERYRSFIVTDGDVSVATVRFDGYFSCCGKSCPRNNRCDGHADRDADKDG